LQVAKYRSRSGYYYYSQSITINAKVPIVPKDIQLEGRKALAKYFGILGEIYAEATFFDLIETPTVPELGLTWIPGKLLKKNHSSIS
jgi:hypothetical protein